jgi:(2Fe-2S) ferredoxin
VLREQLAKHGLTDRVTIGLSGCLGMCEKGPMMVVNPGYTIYGGLTEKDIPQIVEEHLVNGRGRKVRASRTRRRGIPDRPQVETDRRGEGDAKVRDL